MVAGMENDETVGGVESAITLAFLLADTLPAASFAHA
jgi:hypothetical protein